MAFKIGRLIRFSVSLFVGSQHRTPEVARPARQTRIEVARAAFTRFKNVLCCRGLKIPIRLNVLRCYTWPSFLYSCETWKLKVAMMNRLELFKMWCYRKILRISWTQHVTNEEVLHKDRELLATISWSILGICCGDSSTGCYRPSCRARSRVKEDLVVRISPGCGISGIGPG